MRLPFLGRLRPPEWPILLGSLLLVILESVVAFVTYLLPRNLVIQGNKVVLLLASLFNPGDKKQVKAELKYSSIGKRVQYAAGFSEMCEIFGYRAEEHVVRTSDGYLLGIHRIIGPRGSSDSPGSSSNQGKTVVYLHHGLLMNSEIWVTNLDPDNCLAFMLADLGYDVWLGNNRGNKYSKKHVTLHPSDTAFWNFSLDDFAFYDIPDTINYILKYTGQSDLVYIGFSQGSAQTFAALSVNPDLNNKVRMFLALAPAMAPPGLENRIVNSLAKASPSVLYLFFGRRIIMPSTTFWRSVMSPVLYSKLIDLGVRLLFDWRGRNITQEQKLAAYAHLYSYTSVKCVVHWFQIIGSGRFHMYDDETMNPLSFSQYYYRVAPFPTRNITTPIILIYGEADSLVDIEIMLKELPSGTVSYGVPGHEHLDIIWGKDVASVVFPHVLRSLAQLSDTDSTKSPDSAKALCNGHCNGVALQH